MLVTQSLISGSMKALLLTCLNVVTTGSEVHHVVLPTDDMGSDRVVCEESERYLNFERCEKART